MESDNDCKSAGAGVNFEISEAMTTKKYEAVNEVIRMCASNIEYYQQDKSFVGTRMQQNFEKLREFLDKSVPVVKEIESFAHKYDYDEKTPGNGYRSFVHIFESAVKYSQKHCQYITDNRASLLFRKSLYQK
jgi:hormone-sensitive lipase